MDSRWIIPLALLVVIVIPAAIAAGPTLIGVLTEDRRPYSLCPDDRNSDQIVGGSQMAAKGTAYQGPGPHQLIVDGPTDADEVLPESWSPPRASNHAGRSRSCSWSPANTSTTWASRRTSTPACSGRSTAANPRTD